jgi:DNA-binding response OmpR family regulator
MLETSDAVFLEIGEGDDLNYLVGLRSRSRKPVLLYGIRVPSSIQIKSLSIGADAFLPLPASSDVLDARVHAFLRRAGLESFKKG